MECIDLNVLAFEFDSYCFTGQAFGWIDTSSVWTINPGLNFSIPIGTKEIDTVVDEYSHPKIVIYIISTTAITGQIQCGGAQQRKYNIHQTLS